MPQKPITAYEIIDHGIDSASYFQGCGLSHTRFEDIATGNGDTFNEALDNALEQLAMGDWDVDGAKLTKEKIDENRDLEVSASAHIHDACECKECASDEDETIDCQGDCDCLENAETYYYVSVRVK